MGIWSNSQMTFKIFIYNSIKFRCNCAIKWPEIFCIQSLKLLVIRGRAKQLLSRLLVQWSDLSSNPIMNHSFDLDSDSSLHWVQQNKWSGGKSYHASFKSSIDWSRLLEVRIKYAYLWNNIFHCHLQCIIRILTSISIISISGSITEKK